MDVMTATLMAALVPGASSIGNAIVNNAVADCYQKLKRLIAVTYGAESKVTSALNGLEQDPTSSARKERLNDELETAAAATNDELINAAHQLIAALNDGHQAPTSQRANGQYIAQAATGANASVSVNFPNTQRINE